MFIKNTFALKWIIVFYNSRLIQGALPMDTSYRAEWALTRPRATWACVRKSTQWCVINIEYIFANHKIYIRIEYTSGMNITI